jgi:hypothetical protein
MGQKRVHTVKNRSIVVVNVMGLPPERSIIEVAGRI